VTNALTLSTADRLTVRAAVAPLLSDARISSPLTSQLVHGDVVQLVDGRGDWLLVRGVDAYEGWLHVGYTMPCSGTESTWRLSLSCVVRDAAGGPMALPLGARVAPSAELLSGLAIAADTRATRFPSTASAIAQSAATLFTGVPYLWGGVSTWGIDCSGLVQRVFALHGRTVPRDAWQQAEAFTAVGDDALAAHAPADLLFFSDRDDRRITHVGIALGDGRMVHSALTRGGVAIETLAADDAYVARLRAQCVGVARAVG
jgi:hypothetical protein